MKISICFFFFMNTKLPLWGSKIENSCAIFKVFNTRGTEGTINWRFLLFNYWYPREFSEWNFSFLTFNYLYWGISIPIFIFLETCVKKESWRASCRESRMGSYAWLSARLSETRFLREEYRIVINWRLNSTLWVSAIPLMLRSKVWFRAS